MTASLTALESKSLDAPDETRPFAKGHLAVVTVGGTIIGRGTFEPGWKWSECIKPVVGTDSCQVAHVGYAVSGRLTVKLNDGTQKTFEPGMSYTIPPGHDAWVEGNERFVCIEVMSAEQFAKA